MNFYFPNEYFLYILHKRISLTFFGNIIELVESENRTLMKKISIIPLFLPTLLIISCNRNSTPHRREGAWVEYKVTPLVSATPVTKPVEVKHYQPSNYQSHSQQSVAIPEVITVNDKVAQRSIDGRYYYDVDGHRYWRNKYNGKYYLFNKSMFKNPAFQP
jgi:hypothetical protein